jgi:hypothetical protein
MQLWPLLKGPSSASHLKKLIETKLKIAFFMDTYLSTLHTISISRGPKRHYKTFFQAFFCRLSLFEKNLRNTMNDGRISLGNITNKRSKHRDLTIEEKNHIISELLAHGEMVENEVRLPPGTVKKIAGNVGVARQIVSRIWTESKNNKNDDRIGAYIFVLPRNKVRPWPGLNGIMRFWKMK